MPRRRRVCSLKETCFKNVTEHMESHWCRDYTENYPDGGGKYMHVVGPFDDLPAGLKHELLLFLGQQRKLRRHHLELLIDESTTTVDFSPAVHAPPLKDALLELIGVRCQNLTELNINGCQKVTPKMLLEAFPNFPKLRVIRMNGTKCSDRVLHVVGHYCHNLVELHVNHCNEVRDGGVRNLLFGTTEAAVQCPDLVKLDLEATKVTVASVQLALLSLPKLQVLESDLLLEAMNNLHEDEFFRLDEQVERAKQHRLTRLGPMSLAGDVEKLGQSLSVAAAYCPNVNEVVMYSYANDESLLTVSRFERLRSMSLLQCFEGISLESGILPLLQIRGPQLHTLVMEVPEIDVPALAYFCPNVRKLGLEFQSCSSETHLAVKVAKNWKPFSHMQWLRVAYQQGASVGQSDLLMLLSHSPDLRYLHLNKLNDLTNEIMATVLEANPMENLENLTLQDCHHITVDAVWPFLLTENELRTLELENCAEITLRDATQMRREIANQKSDLELKWT